MLDIIDYNEVFIRGRAITCDGLPYRPGMPLWDLNLDECRLAWYADHEADSPDCISGGDPIVLYVRYMGPIKADSNGSLYATPVFDEKCRRGVMYGTYRMAKMANEMLRDQRDVSWHRDLRRAHARSAALKTATSEWDEKRMLEIGSVLSSIIRSKTLTHDQHPNQPPSE